MAVFGLAMAVASAASAQHAGYSEETAQACLDCHETERVMGIVDTVHADFDDPRTPAAQKQCQSCHGPSKAHTQFPLQVANLRFGKGSKVPAKTQNEVCLECHTGEKRENWHASAHGFEDIVCSTCHDLHSSTNIVLAGAQLTAGCGASGCHEDLVSEAGAGDFSHPVGLAIPGAEAFTCSDCHDPHGPLGSGRCGDCHAQKPEVIAQQSEKARRFHEVASARGTGCIRCHRGISHPLPDDVLEASQRERSRHAR